MQQEMELKGKPTSPGDKSAPYNAVASNDEPATPGYDGLTLDKVYQEIGFGLYQIRLIGIIGLVALSEGAQIIVFTLVLTVLQNEWGYDEDVQSAVASCAFLGILLGCGSAGIIADRFGRKWCILGANVLLLIINTCSVFSPNILVYGITRFLLSFVMGFYAPIGFTLCIENIPINTRANVVIFANCLIFVGELFACLVAYLTLDNLTDGNWKALTLYTATPAVLALILGFLFLDESARYELVNKNYDKAFEIVNKINDTNGKRTFDALSYEYKQELQEYEEKLARESNHEVASFKSLFQGDFTATTLILWFTWFVNSFVYFGITIFMPYVLEKMQDMAVGTSASLAQSQEDIGSIALSVLVESSSVIVAAVAIDTNAYGRKTVLSLFYGITAVFAFVTFFMATPGLYVIFATGTKVALDVCVFYQYLYVIEVYPTKIRATGVGMAGGIGKTGAIIMPWIYIIMMDDASLNSPMMLNSMLCIAALVAITFLPIETLGRELK
jgi:MFS family permease